MLRLGPVASLLVGSLVSFFYGAGASASPATINVEYFESYEEAFIAACTEVLSAKSCRCVMEDLEDGGSFVSLAALSENPTSVQEEMRRRLELDALPPRCAERHSQRRD